MPRIPELPSLEVIKGFRGLLDFVAWRGIYYVRSWPQTPRERLTPATLAAAALFGNGLKTYAWLAGPLISFLQQDSYDQPLTARDLYMRALYGHLHIRGYLGVNTPFGYSDRILDNKEQTSVNGNTTVDSDVVPAGEIWVIASLTASHNDPISRRLSITARSATDYSIIARKPDISQWATIQGARPVILKQGDYLQAECTALATGRKVFLSYNGYKMEVPL